MSHTWYKFKMECYGLEDKYGDDTFYGSQTEIAFRDFPISYQQAVSYMLYFETTFDIQYYRPNFLLLFHEKMFFSNASMVYRNVRLIAE